VGKTGAYITDKYGNREREALFVVQPSIAEGLLRGTREDSLETSGLRGFSHSKREGGVKTGSIENVF